MGEGVSPACSNSEAISVNVLLSGVSANISALVGCAGEAGDGSGGGVGRDGGVKSILVGFRSPCTVTGFGDPGT